MPVSRTRNKMLFCPGCRLRCWAGAKRLIRHMRNQCTKHIQERAKGVRKHYTGYFMGRDPREDHVR